MIRGVEDASDYDARHVAKTEKGKTWPVYKRLLGYVMAKHKTRLAVAFVCGFLAALSLGAVLLGGMKYLEVVFAEEAAPGQMVAEVQDQVGGVVSKIGLREDLFNDWIAEWVPYYRDQAHQMEAVLWLAAAILAAVLLGGAARFFQEYLSASIATYVTIDLGRQMYSNIIHMPLRFYEKHTTGEIIARLTNDIFMAGRGLSQVFMKLMREPIKAVMFLGAALWLDWKLTMIVLCVFPPVTYVIVRIGRSVRKRMRRSLEKVAELQSVAKETITGITIVKGFCMEMFAKDRMHREYRKLRTQGLKMLKADAAIGPVTEFLMACGFVVFVVFSARQVIEHDMTLFKLITLYGFLLGMLDPVRKLTAVNNAIQSSVASAIRAFEFIDMKSDIVDAPDAVALPPLSEALKLDDVHYSYDGKTPVLQGVSFEVKKGEMVAIVGESGAGKSTLAKLVPRFYDVGAGSIAIDGTDIRKATQASLREQISIVTQDTILFHDTVAANIAAERPDYSPDRIRQAASAAHADEFVERLSQGYYTNIGEAGGTLSGGQRQRLAIARALIKDPAILILDEATSSLDSESEHAIQQAIEEFIVGRTTIVIAHRLSTVRRADRILVMDGGRIVEQGSHDELLQREGSIYRRLYETQFATREQQEEGDAPGVDDV